MTSPPDRLPDSEVPDIRVSSPSHGTVAGRRRNRLTSDSRVLSALLATTVLLIVGLTLWNEADSLRIFGDSETTQRKMQALSETKAAYRPDLAVHPVTLQQTRRSTVTAATAADEEQAAIAAWGRVTRSGDVRPADWRRLGITLALFHKPGVLAAFRHIQDQFPALRTRRRALARHFGVDGGLIADPFGDGSVDVSPVQEMAAWETLYGSAPLAPAHVPALLHLLSRLKLGWFENVAAAQLYARAGLMVPARRAADAANGSALLSQGLYVLELGVLLFGAIGLFGLGLYRAASHAQQVDGVRKIGDRGPDTQRVFTGSLHDGTQGYDTILPPVRPTGRPAALLFPYPALIQTFLIYLVGQETLGLLAGLALWPFHGLVEQLTPLATLRLELVLQLVLYIPALGLPLLVLRRKIGFDPTTGAALSLRALLVQIGFRTYGVLAEIASGAFGYAVSMLPIMVATVLSERLFSHLRTPNNPADLWMFSAQSNGDRLLILLLATVVAPFAEETLFRGILYPALRGKFGVWGAAALSGAIFSAVHPTLPAGFLPIWAVGVALALVYEWRRSLLPGMVLHGLFNGFITLTTFAVFAR